jgi:outer membrane receptor protein involved in Fe transport
MTTGIGKPVIRGLSSNRVVVLDNGQRVESQQWGTDHAPNLETEHSDRVEVIKGPASVLWGSDAIGGVIQVVPRPLPDAIGRRSFTTGRLSTLYNSNLRGPDATLTLEGARGGLGWRTTGTARHMGDMRAPGTTLRNTGNTTTNLQGAIGWTGPQGRIALRASNRDERIEIYEDPAEDPAYSGYQDIRTTRLALDGTLPLGPARLEVNLGWERNRRAEFDDAAATAVTLGLGSATTSGYAHYHHRPIGRMEGLIGVFGWHQRFRKFGTETLIPNTNATDLAAFIFEQAEVGRWSLSAGARWDIRTLSTPGDRELALAPANRSWQAVTGNAAAAYRLRDGVALVANVGRGFRAPSSSDLFANGFHEGSRAFERGDPTVGVETSLNADLGLRLRRPGTSAELHGYSNRIADFIYLRPFGAAGARFDSLAVTQGNAWLRGVEGTLTQQLGRWVAISGTADLTLGDNTSTDTPLTYIPPFRGLAGIRIADAAGGGRFLAPTLQFTAEHHARQTRLDPMDIGTPAYSLLHLVGGLTVPTRRAPITVDLAIRNLGNVRYRQFMSRYKEFADGMGRTVTLRISAILP